MRMFITSKNKYLSNDMKIFGTCSIPLNKRAQIEIIILYTSYCVFGVMICDDNNFEMFNIQEVCTGINMDILHQSLGKAPDGQWILGI